MAEQIEAVLVRAAELTAGGQPRAAIALLRPVLVARPTHSAAWCRLAVAHLDAGEPTESLDAAKRAIMLGERSWGHRLASLALLELGRHEEAVVSAGEAVRRDPADWRCHVALAEALGPTSPQDAVGAAHRALSLAPREARPHEVLGDAAARVDDQSLARRAYRDALRLDPGNEHVAAKLRRLAGPDRARNRPARPPKRAAPVRPARFGRPQRTAFWLMLRRAAVWLAIGTFLLLIAGLPTPNPLLVWFGAGLLLFVLGLIGHAWLGLPPGAQVGLAVLTRGHPLMVITAVLLAVSLLALAMWTVALGLGARGMQLLTVALACSSVAGGVCWYGLWRLRGPSR